MAGLIASVRRRLSYATVVSALSAFLLLAGGAALAAGGLGKNSVGSPQLRKNAVTTAKLKKSSVTAAKIKKSSVTGAKFKAGSVSAQSLDLGSTGYSRTVHIARSAGPVAMAKDLTPIPLTEATFSQAPGEDVYFLGTFTGTMPPECEGTERSLFVGAWLDNGNLSEPEIEAQIVGENFRGRPPGTFSATVPLGPDKWSFQPASPTTHTISAYGDVNCAGAAKVGTIDSVEIRVVATR